MSKRGKKGRGKEAKGSPKGSPKSNTKHAPKQRKRSEDSNTQQQDSDEETVLAPEESPEKNLEEQQSMDQIPRHILHMRRILDSYPAYNPIDFSRTVQESPLNLSKDSDTGEAEAEPAPLNLSRHSGSGSSALLRELLSGPLTAPTSSKRDRYGNLVNYPEGASRNLLRDPEASQARALDADPSAIPSTSRTGSIYVSRELGAFPSYSHSSSAAGPSYLLRDMEAGPSASHSGPEADANVYRDLGAGTSTSQNVPEVRANVYRDLGAGPSTSRNVPEVRASVYRDLGAGPSTSHSVPEVRATVYRDLGAGPSTSHSVPEVRASVYRDLGAGPGTLHSGFEAGRIYVSNDLGAHPSVPYSGPEAGANAYRDLAAGPSTSHSGPEAGRIYMSRDLGAHPSTSRSGPEERANVYRDLGAGPSTAHSGLKEGRIYGSRDSGAHPSTSHSGLDAGANLSRDLGAHPSSSYRGPAAANSYVSRDMGAGPSSSQSDSGTSLIYMSRDLGTYPYVSHTSLATGTSYPSRDLGSGQSTVHSGSGTGVIYPSRDLGAHPSHSGSTADAGYLLRYLEAGPSTSQSNLEGPIYASRDLGAGPSTLHSGSGTGAMYASRDLGAHPNTSHSGLEAGSMYMSRDLGAYTSTSHSGSTAAASYVRDMATVPSASHSGSETGTGKIYVYRDVNTGAIYVKSDLGVGPSTSNSGLATDTVYLHSNLISGPSTLYSGGAVGIETSYPIIDLEAESSDSRESTDDRLRNLGAGPSNPLKESRAGPSSAPYYYDDDFSIVPDPLNGINQDQFERMKWVIVDKFLNLPKAVIDLMTPEQLTELKLCIERNKSGDRSIRKNFPIRKYQNNEKDKEYIEDEETTISCESSTSSNSINKRKDPPDNEKASRKKKDNQVSNFFLNKHKSIQICQISSSISEIASGVAQENDVAFSKDVNSLSNNMLKCKISTTDAKLEFRDVQEIEREVLQMDVVREPSNLSDFGTKFIEKLAASLLENMKPVVLDVDTQDTWPRKKVRVPSVFLHPPFEFRTHIRNLLSLGIQFYNPDRNAYYTKILGLSFEDQRKLTQYFDENQIPYHTFGHPSDKMAKVVIRGLSSNIDLSKIKEELTAASIPVVSLHKMDFKGIRRRQRHLILAIVPQTEEGLRILMVRKIFGQLVTLEPADVKTMQCHRCQRWGHVQRYCRGPIKCVKCAGDHWTAECLRDPQDDPPSCANCGGDHTASYRQCHHCPDSERYKSRQFEHIIRIIKKAQVTPTPKRCKKLYVDDQVDLPIKKSLTCLTFN